MQTRFSFKSLFVVSTLRTQAAAAAAATTASSSSIVRGSERVIIVAMGLIYYDATIKLKEIRRYQSILIDNWPFLTPFSIR